MIVFSAHGGNETLACRGTIIKQKRGKSNIHHPSGSQGGNSHKKLLNVEENPPPKEVKMLIRNEVKEVAKILGVKAENVFFLDFEDGILKDNTFQPCIFVKNFNSAKTD